MVSTPTDLTAAALEFLAERHHATLATPRPNGTPHVVALGFTYDPDTRIARVITSDGTQKARNVERSGYAALTQVDGGRWLTLEGPARVLRDPADVTDAEERYTRRYKPPRENPRRVVIAVEVERVLGARSLTGRPRTR